jgi:uncharacterized protein (DUF433 family)
MRKLSEGYTREDLAEMYPVVTGDDILAALACAAAAVSRR